MLTTTAGKTASLTDTQRATRNSGKLVAKKIWLPKLLYDALPWFYVCSGLAALAATLYISEWFWVLPHYLLFSVGCVHLGLLVYRRRRRLADET